eukprot:1098159-Rhodomonas_salina.1
MMHNNNKPEADKLIRDLLNPGRVQPIDTQTIAHLNRTIQIDTALRKLVLEFAASYYEAHTEIVSGDLPDVAWIYDPDWWNV